MTCFLGHDRCKPADQIAPGDVIADTALGGGAHVVTRVEPYTHPTLGAFVGAAICSDGWGLTLEATVCVEVA